LIEIHFQHKEDASRLYSFLNKLIDRKLYYQYILQNEDSHKILFKGVKGIEQEELLCGVRDVLSQFILAVKVNDWLKDILSTKYFYRDEMEQQQIIDIVHAVLEGKHKELAVFLPQLNMEKYVFNHVNDWFYGYQSFSFDAFVAFRLRSLLCELQKYVELSLDEYKMEQEYQMFIQTLREFLVDRDSQIEQLHVLFCDEATRFFDKNYNEIKRSELTKMVDRKLLINHPVYVDSVIIAPLLSIAPIKIYVYVEDFDQPIVRTIRNIFEERLIMKTPDVFDEYKKSYLSSFNEKYNTP
jgi:putative sporulation protein YtxC